MLQITLIMRGFAVDNLISSPRRRIEGRSETSWILLEGGGWNVPSCVAKHDWRAFSQVNNG
jgi:hypothetical protein